MARFRKSSPTSRAERPYGHHRFEHWYRDNTVYFLTSRCKDRFPAFASERAKQIFWNRFEHYAAKYTFTPCIVSLIDNHYHILGYLKIGENLGPMMRHFHGSVAKLVNDVLAQPIKPFWWDSGRQGYFDGCIRDETQCRRAYRYTQLQSVRHGLCKDWRDYPHTKIYVDVDRMVQRALELNAFMTGVPYARYQRPST